MEASDERYSEVCGAGRPQEHDSGGSSRGWQVRGGARAGLDRQHASSANKAAGQAWRIECRAERLLRGRPMRVRYPASGG